MGKNDPLKIIGIVLIVLGILVILTGVPLTEQQFLPGEEILAEKVEPINATRIIAGATISILGLIIYLGREGLKYIGGRK